MQKRNKEAMKGFRSVCFILLMGFVTALQVYRYINILSNVGMMDN